MDGIDPEQTSDLAAVVEVLARQRPVLAFDERQRVDRRLNTFVTARRRRRPGSRLAVVICLTFGLLFMTAGTGIAISGFAIPEPGQYSSATTDGPAAPAAVPGQRAPDGNPASSKLSQLQSAGTLTAAVSLQGAETHNNLPFTGFDVIPILLGGIGFIVTGAAINRRIA